MSEKTSHNEVDTYEDLMNAVDEGEQQGLETKIAEMPFTSKSDMETATKFVNRDAERIKEIKMGLARDYSASVNMLDKRQVPEKAHPGIDALRKNEKEFNKPKSKFSLKRLLGL